MGILCFLSGPRGEAGGAEPWFVPCRQVLLVVADDWSSSGGSLTALSKGDGGWKVDLEGIPIVLGHNGLGLGEGLHRGGHAGPEKREGDRRAPAGIFPLEFSFGTTNRPDAGFPYRKTTTSDYWVDDPKSRSYNRWVDLADRSVSRDWSSAERLRRADGLYDLAVVVGHNRRAFVPGKGSAIFVHSWSGPGRPTIGCTAMSPEDL